MNDCMNDCMMDHLQRLRSITNAHRRFARKGGDAHRRFARKGGDARRRFARKVDNAHRRLLSFDDVHRRCMLVGGSSIFGMKSVLGKTRDVSFTALPCVVHQGHWERCCCQVSWTTFDISRQSTAEVMEAYI